MCSLIATGVLFLALSNTVSASDCFLSDNIECSCSGASLRCFGVQRDITEVKQLLLNVTTTYSTIDFLYLDWNIKNLTFESNFTFESFKLQNMTVGSDLTSLPDNLFLGLESTLISLNLQNNKIEFNNQPFSSLYNLKELFLDFNGFYEINTDVLFNLSKLELLSLSGNFLNRLENNFLINLPKIHTLILDSNNFSSVSDIRINSLNLKKLVARNCSMNGSLTTDSLKYIQNLEHLDFSSNQLEEVESYAFSDLHNLKELNLSYNVLNSLKDNALSALHQLESLDLSNNKLLRIAPSSFQNLTNLKHLDLSENRLEVFYKKYTMDLVALESINLENNKIKLITTGTFSTSSKLQAILLKGNVFDCTCESSYFASYLSNNSHIILGDNNAAICDTGTALIDIDFVALNCFDEPDIDDDDYDYDEDESVTKTDEPTTERTSDGNYNGTTEIDPTTLSTVVNITERNETSNYNDTSDTLPASLPIAEITTTERISTDSYSDTSNSSDVITDSSSLSFSSDDLSTQETNTPNSTPHTIKNETTTLSPALEDSTLMSTTLSNDLNSTSDSRTKVTTESVLHITQTEASKSLIDILERFIMGKDLCIRWKISDKINKANNCVVITEQPRGRTQKRVSCPTSNKGKQQCVPTMTYRLCINVDQEGEPTKQYCPITPTSTTVTGSLPSSSIPNTSPVSMVPTTSSISEVPSTLPISEIPFTLPISETPSTVPISETPSTVPISKTPSTVPISELPSTYTPTVLPNSSTDPIKIYVEKTIPETKSKSNAIYFKVVSFDMTFMNLNSAAIIKWTVNKIEPKSVCHLKLYFSSYNFNDSRGEFPCANNSHSIENIEYGDYKVCLMSYHAHYNTQVMCKSLSNLDHPATSKYKDHGYANSPLIAVICLLIVVLIVIVILVMKKMLKKRSESDRYNVSAEEQKVQKRFSQKRPESCVRYSYTVKNQGESMI